MKVGCWETLPGDQDLPVIPLPFTKSITPSGLNIEAGYLGLEIFRKYRKLWVGQVLLENARL